MPKRGWKRRESIPAMLRDRPWGTPFVRSDEGRNDHLRSLSHGGVKRLD